MPNFDERWAIKRFSTKKDLVMCSIDIVLLPVATATLNSIPENLHGQRGLSEGLLSFSLPAVMLAAAFPTKFNEFKKSRSPREIQSNFVPVCLW